MGVTVEIEVGEIGNRLGRSVRRHLAGPYEASQALGHFNVRQVGRMELVTVTPLHGRASCGNRPRRATLFKV